MNLQLGCLLKVAARSIDKVEFARIQLTYALGGVYLQVFYFAEVIDGLSDFFSKVIGAPLRMSL